MVEEEIDSSVINSTKDLFEKGYYEEEIEDKLKKMKYSDEQIKAIFEEAQRLRVRCLQIVHGKGTGRLKRSVDRFLKQPEVKAVTRNIDHDSKNWGRLFVYFRWPERSRVRP